MSDNLLSIKIKEKGALKSEWFWNRPLDELETHKKFGREEVRSESDTRISPQLSPPDHERNNSGDIRNKSCTVPVNRKICSFAAIQIHPSGKYLNYYYLKPSVRILLSTGMTDKAG